jgi:hypothetical protein
LRIGNITMMSCHAFDKHRASAGSITSVADRNNGKIIAFPNKQKGVRIDSGTLRIATLADIDDPVVREAHQQHVGRGADRFVSDRGERRGVCCSLRQFSGRLRPALQVITLTLSTISWGR